LKLDKAYLQGRINAMDQQLHHRDDSPTKNTEPKKRGSKAKTEQGRADGKGIPGQYGQKCTVEEDQLSLP
jgi:hypothetical protein